MIYDERGAFSIRLLKSSRLLKFCDLDDIVDVRDDFLKSSSIK